MSIINHSMNLITSFKQGLNFLLHCAGNMLKGKIYSKVDFEFSTEGKWEFVQ